MVLPDTFKYVHGTPLVFSNTGEYVPTLGQPAGVDAALDLQLATTGIAIQSVKMDLGSLELDALWKMRAFIEVFSAPTAGGTVDFYANWSGSTVAGTDNNGNASGASAVYQGYGADTASGTEALPQLEFIGSMTFTADIDLQVADIGVFAPSARYMSLIIVNNTSLTLAATDAIESCVAIEAVQHQIVD